jgi:hypothetical protein
MENFTNPDKIEFSTDGLIWKLHADITNALQLPHGSSNQIVHISTVHRHDVKQKLDELGSVRRAIIKLGTKVNINNTKDFDRNFERLEALQEKVLSRHEDLQKILEILKGGRHPEAIYSLEILEEHQS